MPTPAPTLFPRILAVTPSVAMFGRLFAAAVEATVVGAGAARAADPLAQRFARPKDAYGSVVARDAGFAGVILHRQPVDFHATQSLGVFGLERCGELADAATHRAPHLALGRDVLLELRRKHLEPAVDP